MSVVLPSFVELIKKVRLVPMHTSADYGSVLYGNQTVQRGPRSLTREDEEEYDDGFSKVAYERFLVWRNEGTYRGP